MLVNVQMPMGVIDHQELDLEIQTDLFLYVTHQGVWMSPDKQSWCMLNDLDDIKKVFGFSHGRLEADITADEEKGLHVNLELVGE